MAIEKPLELVRGKTLFMTLRWGQETPIVSKAISAISFATGFPRLTVPLHGLTNGWPSTVVLVDTPKQINAQNDVPRESDHHDTTIIDPNTIEYNGVVPVTDGRKWAAYTSGGFVQYNTPRDLTGYIIRAKVRDKVGGALLLSSEASDSPLNLITATADNATKTINIEISDETIAALTWSNGVWEVEGESPTGKVEPIVLISPVTVGDEVATT